jgi:hypothetical protein
MVDRGLQPLCVFLAVFPGVFSVFIVGLRIWIRVKSKQYGIGKLAEEPHLLLAHLELTTIFLEDTLLAIASVRCKSVDLTRHAAKVKGVDIESSPVSYDSWMYVPSTICLHDVGFCRPKS